MVAQQVPMHGITHQESEQSFTLMVVDSMAICKQTSMDRGLGNQKVVQQSKHSLMIDGISDNQPD